MKEREMIKRLKIEVKIFETGSVYISLNRALGDNEDMEQWNKTLEEAHAKWEKLKKKPSEFIYKE